MSKCKECGCSKEDLVHPENWGEHQYKMERLNPGILKSAIPNAHTFVPPGNCEDCEGTGIYLLPDDSEQTCVPCGGTGWIGLSGTTPLGEAANKIALKIMSESKDGNE